MHCLRKIVISSVSLLVTSTSCGSSATFSARRRITNDSMYLPLPVAGLMPAREEKKQQRPDPGEIVSVSDLCASPSVPSLDGWALVVIATLVILTAAAILPRRVSDGS